VTAVIIVMLALLNDGAILSIAYDNMGRGVAPVTSKNCGAKGIVSKIGNSRRYQTVPEGIRSPTALLVLRKKIIRPLLAAGTQPEPRHACSSDPRRSTL
jgi:hypothetical protein